MNLVTTTTVGIIFTPDYDFIPGTLSVAFDVVTIDVVDVVCILLLLLRIWLVAMTMLIKPDKVL